MAAGGAGWFTCVSPGACVRAKEAARSRVFVVREWMARSCWSQLPVENCRLKIAEIGQPLHSTPNDGGRRVGEGAAKPWLGAVGDGISTQPSGGKTGALKVFSLP
jgi:hypothetical protein